jgi:cytochrome c oxidase subunit 1
MTPAMGATVLMLATFLLGGCTGIILGSAAADIYMHDTMFVVAHFHYTMVPIVIFAPIAGFYHYFPKMFGKPLDGPLAWLHIIGTGIFFNLCFLPIFTLGFMGHQRRISDPTQFGYIDGGESLQVLATVGAIGALVSQIPFAINLLKSLLSKRKAESNPWKATTLDWQTPSPPPHGNFASTPTVYRGPYFYSPPGIEADYIPQDQQPDTAPPDHSQAPASEPTTTPA